MTPAFQTQIDRWIRFGFPLASIFVAALIGVIALPVPDYGVIAPAFSFMAVFCWSLWRPELTPYVGIFVIGLFEDLLKGTPIGTTAVLLLVCAGFVRGQSGFLIGKGFEFTWLVFALCTLLALVVEWVMLSVAFGTVLNPLSAIFRSVLTLVLFPLMSVLLFWVNRSALRHI